MKQACLHVVFVFGALALLASEAAAQVQTNATPYTPAPMLSPELRWREMTWLGHHNGAGMAYDPVRERTVIFGGWSANTAGDTTWVPKAELLVRARRF